MMISKLPDASVPRSFGSSHTTGSNESCILACMRLPATIIEVLPPIISLGREII